MLSPVTVLGELPMIRASDLWMRLERENKALELAGENEHEGKKKPISGHGAAESEGNNETELVLTDNLKLPGTL